MDPHRPGARKWLELNRGEVEPTVIEAERPHLVVWSSLWLGRPHDRIRFVIAPDGGGSRLAWVLETDSVPPDDDAVDQMRHRINFLINGQLRYSFD